MRFAPFLLTMLRPAAVALGCAAAFAPHAACAAPVLDEKPHAIEAPHYGDALFYFYQEHYFSAIIKLMVSQQFGRIAPHDDEAEVLRGGMLLSYGMPDAAGTIFAKLIERGTPAPIRDRAWFFLAKIRYQRGELDQAQQAMLQVGNRLAPELAEERGLLEANLAMAREDYASAATILGAMNSAKSTSATARRYVRFNLGVSLIRTGDNGRGIAMLEELGREPAENEEYRVLRDRANVALGFAALKDKHPEAARGFLERVRLNGPLANKALLGSGWAAAEMKQPKVALVSWLELGQRNVNDSAVLESRIAVPYAYAELEAYGQALTHYNEAITDFDRERRDLDESIGAIRSGKLLDSLLARNPGEGMGWFQTLTQLPEMPHPEHLAPVLAQHEFQEAFKDYRDLQFLAENLGDWSGNLGVLGDMLANRQNAYAQRLPEVRAKAQASGLGALQQRVDALAAEVRRAEGEPDGALLADAHQKQLQATLERVRAGIEEMGDSAEATAARARYRLVAGAMNWQLAQQYPAKLRETQTSLRQIDKQVKDALDRDAALAQAQRDEPVRFARFAARIEALRPRLQALIPRVNALAKEEQLTLQEIAVAELEGQKDRLIEYATQARFAVAQIYDRANQKREAGRAIKQ